MVTVFFIAAHKHIDQRMTLYSRANPKIACTQTQADITDYIVKNARQLGLNIEYAAWQYITIKQR